MQRSSAETDSKSGLATQHSLLVESLYTIKNAAEALGIQPWKLRRAVKLGLIPSYTLVNARRLVRLSEVVASLHHANVGGA